MFVECFDKDKDTDENVDADRDRTVRPVGAHWSLQLEEIDIDFKVSGLPHAVVKQAEDSRVRELVKKIESHPHRQALQADLQQSNAYNPFSEKSMKMIREMGNVELFELFETAPKIQCKECLLYWNQGIVYCTCWHLLRINPAEVSSDGHWIFSQSRTMSLRKGDLVAIVIDRTEEVCIQINKDAEKDFNYRMTEEEYFRYKKKWWIFLNESGKIGPTRDRFDFNEALTKLHVFTKSLEKSNSRRFLSGNTINGIHHLLHPAHLGGNGTILGGAHKNSSKKSSTSELM